MDAADLRFSQNGKALSPGPAPLLVQQGYFDLACPYGTVEYFIDHLDVPPDVRANVSIEYYEAGHMMYVHPRRW